MLRYKPFIQLVLYRKGQRVLIEPNPQIWKAFSAAIGAELRDDTTIRGASGLEHVVQAIAVDDRARRVIIIAAEADPRLAALVQVDVQATMPDAKVLIARPIAIDISMIARSVLEPFNVHEFDFDRARIFLKDMQSQSENETKALVTPLADDAVANIPKIFENVALPVINQIVSVISQSAMLPWNDIWKLFSETAASGKIDLKSLIARDTIAADLQAGICPIPLYEFSESDFYLFRADNCIEDCRERLKSMGIYQYFFPAPDQLALALVESGVGDREFILRDTKLAPSMGHPFGEVELIDGSTELKELVDSLNDRKMIVEGEFGFEISPQGKSVRGQIKFAPREGLVEKILKRISLSVSPKDFM